MPIFRELALLEPVAVGEETKYIPHRVTAELRRTGATSTIDSAAFGPEDAETWRVRWEARIADMNTNWRVAEVEVVEFEGRPVQREDGTLVTRLT